MFILLLFSVCDRLADTPVSVWRIHLCPFGGYTCVRLVDTRVSVWRIHLCPFGGYTCVRLAVTAVSAWRSLPFSESASFLPASGSLYNICSKEQSFLFAHTHPTAALPHDIPLFSQFVEGVYDSAVAKCVIALKTTGDSPRFFTKMPRNVVFETCGRGSLHGRPRGARIYPKGFFNSP